ncbi:MAG: cysteine desulfurase family protein [Planctomycetota bacterium]
MPETPVYMDNHATTRVDPRVVQSMVATFENDYGNAGSTGHVFGEKARDLVEQARGTIASVINANPREIVFTSGATESNNLAIRGLVDSKRRKGNHIVSVTTEHKAVLDPLEKMARREIDVTLLPTVGYDSDKAGLLDVDSVADAIREDTFLVSVMLANNETGVIQPLKEIAALCKQRDVLLHTDATQAVGKIPVDVVDLDVDLMSFTAHKIYGPKGIGGLFVRRRSPQVRLNAQIDGGGQERGMRSGTLNVSGIVGFARALEICAEEMGDESPKLAALRNRLWEGLARQIDGIELNGPALDSGIRLDANLNVRFADVDGEALLLNMPDLAVSSGSACTSANPQPSHVLQALGLSEDLTRSSLRFGLGRFNTQEDVDFAIEHVSQAVQRLRSLG